MTFVRTAAIGTATAGGGGGGTIYLYIPARSLYCVSYYNGIRSGPGAREVEAGKAVNVGTPS